MGSWWGRFLEWLFKEEADVPSPDSVHHQAPEWAQVMYWELTQQLSDVRDSLHSVHHKLRILGIGEQEIMTAVQVQQEDLDAVGTKIEALVAAVDGIDTTQLPAGTFDAVNAALTDLTEHVNAKVPVSTPVTPPADPGDGGDTPPADGGDTPVDGGDTPVDPDPVDTPVDPDAPDA